MAYNYLQMKALYLSARGVVNSFRQPDHHTFHKTLPLPPKTTVAGLIGAALGIGPEVVNEEWLVNNRFSVAIRGQYEGMFKDLWQFRKYTPKHISSYEKGEEDFPWFTSVTIRELLYALDCEIFIATQEHEDLRILQQAFQNPAWALSLGRDDELINMKRIEIVELTTLSGRPSWSNTVMPFDVFSEGASLDSSFILGKSSIDLMSYAPKVLKLPTQFEYDDKGERNPKDFKDYTFVGDLPIFLNNDVSYYIMTTSEPNEHPLLFI